MLAFGYVYDDRGLVTERVWWWNNQGLHAEVDYPTPIEAEQAYHADSESAQPTTGGPGNR
jgi:hypothetical protein